MFVCSAVVNDDAHTLSHMTGIILTLLILTDFILAALSPFPAAIKTSFVRQFTSRDVHFSTKTRATYKIVLQAPEHIYKSGQGQG